VSSPAASTPAPLVVAMQRLRRSRDIALSIRPAYVLGGLILVQWLAVLALALTVRHNGWLYYAGGDQLWHYTGAYLLAHGHLPPAYVGYGWSVLLAPLAALAGPNLVSALPGIVLFNTLILLPVALFCVYDICTRVAGRLFGYFAAGLWIALPYLGILFVEPGSRPFPTSRPQLHCSPLQHFAYEPSTLEPGITRREQAWRRALRLRSSRRTRSGS
jgi:hypothetical protein